MLNNGARPLSTALVAALGSYPITENRKGGGENKDRRKRHPDGWPNVSAHSPRVPHTERNAFFQIGLAIFARDSPLTTRHSFFL